MQPEWDLAEEGADDEDGDGAAERAARAGSADAELAAFAPVLSFRSPVHKALFKERNACFAMYAKAFRAVCQQCLDELKSSKTKEELGEITGRACSTSSRRARKNPQKNRPSRESRAGVA